jgi:hypothetical protein
MAVGEGVWVGLLGILVGTNVIVGPGVCVGVCVGVSVQVRQLSGGVGYSGVGEGVKPTAGIAVTVAVGIVVDMDTGVFVNTGVGLGVVT